MRVAIACLSLFAALLPPAAAAAASRLAFADAARRAEAVVVVDLVGVDQRAVAGSGEGVAAFVRHRSIVRVVRVVAGLGLRAGDTVAIDDHQWRLDLAAHLRCRGARDCVWPDKPTLDTSLSRPPRAGQRVIALVRRTADGWELAVDLGFDDPARAPVRVR